MASRTPNKEILEIFGYPAADTSAAALNHNTQKTCPFVNKPCTKTNHDKSIIYGVCSVTGSNRSAGESAVIICPNRLYANDYSVLQDVAKNVWGSNAPPFVAGGTINELREQALRHNESIVALGKNSGKEVQISANGQLSMDWVLQKYQNSGALELQEYVGIEVQSIDITGNYRDSWHAYQKLRGGNSQTPIPAAAHGLNWANVHKRLIPQIIRKGNVYRNTKKCVGFYFLLPDVVYQKFEETLGVIDQQTSHSKHNVSVITYSFDGEFQNGRIRPLIKTRVIHHSLEDIKQAFSNHSDTDASDLLDNTLTTILEA
jgi:hypothetical protein